MPLSQPQLLASLISLYTLASSSLFLLCRSSSTTLTTTTTTTISTTYSKSFARSLTTTSRRALSSSSSSRLSFLSSNNRGASSSTIPSPTHHQHHHHPRHPMHNKHPHMPPSPRTLGIVHTFSGNALDRSRHAVELKEPKAFEAALHAPNSSFALFHGTSVLVSPSSSSSTPQQPPQVVFQNAQELQAGFGIATTQLVLSTSSSVSSTSSASASLPCIALGAIKDKWVFAIDVTSFKDKESLQTKSQQPFVFQPVRSLLGSLSTEDVAVAGQGAAALAWHRQNQYCGVCGSPMVAVEAGGRRACTSPTCKNRAYPRVDPVTIALVYYPPTDSILLGRQRVYRPGMYSCLAGYVEQVESLEEGVAREVKEESGIDVGAILYHSSQPWPIGRGASCQLMMGFICEATSTDIHMDDEELEDCRWFTRAEVAAARELTVTAATAPATASGPGAGPGEDGAEKEEAPLSIPGPYAIAHHLIKHWLVNIPPPHTQQQGRL